MKPLIGLKPYIDMRITDRIPESWARKERIYYVGVYLRGDKALYGKPRLWRPMAFNEPDYIIRVRLKA